MAGLDLAHRLVTLAKRGGRVTVTVNSVKQVYLFITICPQLLFCVSVSAPKQKKNKKNNLTPDVDIVALQFQCQISQGILFQHGPDTITLHILCDNTVPSPPSKSLAFAFELI